MASLIGHAIPGTFLLLFGIWWSVKYPLKYLCRKKKNAYPFGSKSGFQRAEVIEGIIKITFSLIGMMTEQFVPSGPHLKLYNYETKQWNYLMNWQHSTMYLFFGLSGLVDVVVHRTNALPVALDRLMLSIAVFMEGLVFSHHTHGRPMLDQHVHLLLLWAIFVGAFIIFLEVFFRGNIVLELFRASVCLLQGSWFWQIGFVLYPPNGSPEWNQMDFSHAMFLSMCYCWHYAFAILTVAVNYTIVYRVVCSKMKRIPAVQIGLLKRSEQDPESEDDI